MKPRSAIPQETADRVVFDSDLQCCVCRRRGVHIHHIDGDPANNEFDDLVLLCFEHHHEVTVKGGLARHLSAGILRHYREHWYGRVRARRDNPHPAGADRSLFRAAMDAVAYLEVKKLRWRLGAAEWDETTAILSKVAVFLEPDAIHARREALYCLQYVADQTRHRMPRHIAGQVARLAIDCLDIPAGLVAVSTATLNEIDVEMFQVALDIGHALVHSGEKYLHDLEIVDHGAELLWRVLRYAHVNSIGELEQEANRWFDWASEELDADGLRLLSLYRDHAISSKRGLPELPDDLAMKMGAEDEPA